MSHEHGRFVVVPASYVYFLRDGDRGTEVLLQLRRDTGYMDDHWAAAAAGHVERGETAFDAARREALEEVGLSDVALEFMTSMQRTQHAAPVDERIDFFFTSWSWSGTPSILEPAKCAELRWCPLDALPEPVVPHERYALGLFRLGPAVPPYTTFGF
ncbi:MAG: NUDIX domain-containing protein [Nocardioidaceae bacterium]